MISNGKCATITRLSAIRTGEQIIYYRGNFVSDVERSIDVPSYHLMLLEIRDYAQAMALHGRAALSVRPVGRAYKDGGVIYEYVATGIESR